MIVSINFKPFIALIGDIKNSRKLEDRSAIQRQFKGTLDVINHKYKDDIASMFMITLGDEFQGLLKTGASVVYIIDQIEREMYPVKFRFGIGIGEIWTDIQPDTPLGSDGPAYYFAREMIDEIRRSEKRKKESQRAIGIKIQDNETVSQLLNTVFHLLSIVKGNWSKRQAETIKAYHSGNGTQADTAIRLNVTQSTVQRALAAASYYTYREALDTVANQLSEIKEATDV